MSIYDNIRARKYENTFPHQHLYIDHSMESLLKKPVGSLTTEQFQQIQEYQKNKDQRNQAKRAAIAYSRENTRLARLFFDDLAAEYGIKDHPKLPILENLAWEYGHSSGFSEVAYYYEDMIDLIS